MGLLVLLSLDRDRVLEVSDFVAEKSFDAATLLAVRRGVNDLQDGYSGGSCAISDHGERASLSVANIFRSWSQRFEAATGALSKNPTTRPSVLTASKQPSSRSTTLPIVRCPSV